MRRVLCEVLDDNHHGMELWLVLGKTRKLFSSTVHNECAIGQQRIRLHDLIWNLVDLMA